MPASSVHGLGLGAAETAASSASATAETLPTRLDDNPDALVSVLYHLDSAALAAAAQVSRCWHEQAACATRIILQDQMYGRRARLPSISASPLQYLSTVERIGSRIALSCAIEEFVNGLWRSAVRAAAASSTHRPAAMMTALCQDSYTRAGQTQHSSRSAHRPPSRQQHARGPHSVTVPHHRTAQREAIRTDPRFTDAVEPTVYQ